MSKLCIMTICLDSMPYITWHLPVFNRLTIPWRWIVAEGAAMNVKDTAWCRPQTPRLSNDGTTEYLNSLKGHPRITVLQRPSWDGKVEQCNACLALIKEPCLLLQVDSDELWTAEQLETLVSFFNAYEQIKSARFLCRYFLGVNVHITSRNGYGNHPGEWLRAWRFEPGMKFLKHEPPVLAGCEGPCATREQTAEVGLVFDHWAYVFEKQVAYKEQFYGYKDAVKHWRRLQENKIWPVKNLQSFLPWVGPGVTADRLFT